MKTELNRKQTLAMLKQIRFSKCPLTDAVKIFNYFLTNTSQRIGS